MDRYLISFSISFLQGFNFLYSFIFVYFKTFKVTDSLKERLLLKIDMQKQRKSLQQIFLQPDGIQMHIFRDKIKKFFASRYSIWYLNVKNTFTAVAQIYKSHQQLFGLHRTGEIQSHLMKLDKLPWYHTNGRDHLLSNNGSFWALWRWKSLDPLDCEKHFFCSNVVSSQSKEIKTFWLTESWLRPGTKR